MARDIAQHLPALRYEISEAQTWTSGNTHTITDNNIRSDSRIFIMHTSAYDGRWHITVSEGSFIITSSDSENGSPTFVYLIL